MTTSSGPDGTGSNDDLPYLPPARPVHPDAPVADASGGPVTPARSPDDDEAPPAPAASASDPEPELPTLPAPSLPAPEPARAIPTPAPAVPAPVVPNEPAATVVDPPSSAPSVPPAPAGAASLPVPDLVESRPLETAMSEPPPATPVDGAAAPAPTEVTDATRQLRAEARRRRRRNARLGWVVVMLLFVGAVVTGWFVYRAFDGGDEALPSAATSPSEPAPADPGDDLGPAVADAREILSLPESDIEDADDELDDTVADSGAPPGDDTPSTLPTAPAGPPPRIANPPAYRTLHYGIRQTDGFDGEASIRLVSATYDTMSDDYFFVVDEPAVDGSMVVSFNGAWRYTVEPDGVHRRMQRSAESVQPEPDTAFASLLSEIDVLPLAARHHAVFVSEVEVSDVGVDGTAASVYGYVLDEAAFRTAAPDDHARWRGLWTSAAHDTADLVVEGTEQVQLREVTPYEMPPLGEPVGLPDLDLRPAGGEVGIVFRVTDRGVVDMAALTFADDAVRIEYRAIEYDDQPAALEFSAEAWVDAP